jgi:hypothetical protein
MKASKKQSSNQGSEAVETTVQRAVIYPKDVESILECRYWTACRLFRKMREYFGKLRWQFITVPEFCAYTGLDEGKVRKLMKD